MSKSEINIPVKTFNNTRRSLVADGHGKVYSIQIRTPFGDGDISSDTWEGLLDLLPAAVRQAVQNGDQNKAFEARVNALYEAFKKRYIGTPSRATSIEKYGLELDLVRCFLNRMTIYEAVKWLDMNKSFKTSKTTVGKYWKKFFLLGFKRKTLNKS